ncbi:MULTISPECIES: aldehyde dehydrogenase family protein [unclassified Rhodococcus (in: high G+C Gram-positive bacteria)]|uniref:aldehyde dehydrogenase family protein n=1 Tax=unclassified Rhodococcus (in: high G+C Gram-positive bacteria) TaxID=192944 RepID=UPI00163AD718|nr:MULTISPECIES: aldehyde dehydrogenase family protein [unclassified Rhodococcus (in: high G+C Gram-positive bacteria)]MBC2637584.1 aldehyde dehydrogenase family protein [Rhodococcus sp. 3A]MBC2644279.1 aldehyde dehydrogenase family protein [Rhodococcus sp. 3A]MBC2890984.1 aldehyde dehydrogenase family protein [Rhodococcus sp. 4CII]MBC2897671.1 aldehyde dehydrogenase family protein [Rhodococcus sp. 4CII]
MTTSVTDVAEVFVGGHWRPTTGEGFDIISPANEEVVARAVLPTQADADTALTLAREAFDDGRWSRLSIDERADKVAAFCAAFERRRSDFDSAWVIESGPTLEHADLLSGAVVAMWQDQVAHARAIPLQERRALPDGEVLIRREPAGVAVVVTTWNGPALYFAMKVVPALLAGCTVVVKSAVQSQLTSRILAECADEAGFPEGVLSVLAAPTPISEYLVADPRVDHVSLTGSIPAGRSVMAACASNLTDLTLELGGKSPAILIGDVPLERVLPSLIPGFIAYQGQICAALTRVLVPEHRRDEIVDALVEQLAGLQIGDPTEAGTVIGPLASAHQFERVRGYIQKGIDEGATLVLGGLERPRSPGFYLAPTVFADVTPEMTIAREEIFGPVLSVMTYRDLDDALAIANGTEYGLAGSVYADDDETALAVASRLESGAVAVNTARPSLFAPFGGRRNSGFGRENGPEGIAEFLRIKSVMLS